MPVALREAGADTEIQDPLELYIRLNELGGLHVTLDGAALDHAERDDRGIF